MLWEHVLQASVSTACSSSPKLSLLEISATKKGKQLVNFDYQNVNSLCSRHHYINSSCQFCVPIEFQYNFRAEQRVSSNPIGRAIPNIIFTASGGEYNHFQGLAAKLATFAISASKHGGQLLNHILTYSKDTTPSPGYLEEWRFS